MNRKIALFPFILIILLYSVKIDAQEVKYFVHPRTGQIIRKPDKSSSLAEWKEYHDFERCLYKTVGRIDRASGIHKGNRVRTLFYNYGTIGKPNTEPSLEWPIGSNEGYGFEFGIMVGAKVRTASGTWKYILSESLDDGDRSPGGASWGWEPLQGYQDPTRSDIAMSTAPDINHDGKPDSWPATWWDDYFQGYIWPGEYGYGITTADEESYWVMDDYYNKEFNRTFFNYPSEEEDLADNGQIDEIYHSDIKDTYYYPDTSDFERGGLGLESLCRGYQWAHTLAQDCIFFIYEITNVGTEDLSETVFGMFGDPHVGGANDYSDDDAFYDTKIDMVYAWDHDSRGDGGFRPGYFGYKFLESPGEPYDGIDNDEDGMIDESMQDGIDNDGDWMSFDDYNGNSIWDEDEDLNDDLGTDGVGPKDANYPGPDLNGTQGNGIPDHGEPNFDETDLDEADQIGLTAFSVVTYGELHPSQDETFYNLMTSEIVDSLFQQTADNVFLYSSGTINLKPADTRRFSIALLFGYDKNDLYHSAGIVQQIYNAGYRFVKAPEKPKLSAFAGDGYVTLYWDTRSEYSRDPVYGFDFEGYAVYRSSDFGFNDPFVITDSQGNPKLWKPIAQFDLVNEYEGPHPVEQINGVHYYMGDNTGLAHSFKDTTVVNGVTYYYAVVAYDTGSVKNNVPPTECTKNIERTITGEIRPDINTVMVTPQAPSAGYQPPEFSLSDENTNFGGTGKISISFINPTEVVDDQIYEIRFTDESMDSVDNDNDGLLDSLDFDELTMNTVYYDLVNITNPDNPIVLYTQSKYLNGEDHNPYINGLKVRVWNDGIKIDESNTGWIAGDCNYDISVSVYSAGAGGVAYPADYELTILDTIIGKSYNNKDVNFSFINLTTGDTAVFVYFSKSKGGRLQSDERILPIIFAGSAYKGTWDIKIKAPIKKIQEIFQDNTGTLWFGADETTDRGLARYAKNKWTTYSSPDIQGNKVTSFTEGMGQVYIGTETGLNYWNGYEMLDVNDVYLADIKIRAMITDKYGYIWIGTAGGITIFEQEKQPYNVISGVDSIPSNDIYSMFYDSQNRIWIGTDKGVTIVDNGNWTPYNDIGLNSTKVISFTEWNGKIWAGTSKGLSYFNENAWNAVQSESLPEKEILDIIPYDGNLYIALKGSSVENGLYKSSDGFNFTQLTLETGELTDNEVSALYVDNLNRLIIGNKNGIDIYSEDEGWSSYNPQPGDIFRVSTKKPFSHLDVYQFTTTAAKIGKEKAKDDLDKIAVVPNPYVATAIWESKPDFVVGRGERKIYFINLPNRGTIRIYTLNGELVKKIPIENNIFNGAVSWNLMNEDNLEIAYGIYIYHVDAGDYGKKIGKFAIVK